MCWVGEVIIDEAPEYNESDTDEESDEESTDHEHGRVICLPILETTASGRWLYHSRCASTYVRAKILSLVWHGCIGNSVLLGTLRFRDFDNF